MTLTPNFLPVGSIVEYDYKNELGKMPVVVYGIHPPTPQKEPRLDGKWLVDIWVDGTTYITTPIDDISPIPLTPEILTEWCNFCVKDMGSSRLFYIGVNPITHDYLFDLTWLDKPELINSPNAPFYRNGAHHIYFLHQLQHLYSALTQTVLPITIK